MSSSIGSIIRRVRHLLEEKNRIIEMQKLEISKLRKQLESANRKIRTLMEEKVELEERIKSLEREAAKYRMQASLQKMLSEKILKALEIERKGRKEEEDIRGMYESLKSEYDDLALQVARYLCGDLEVRKTLENKLLESENVKAKILIMLSRGVNTISDLATSLGMNEDAILDPLKELASAGFVKVDGGKIILSYAAKEEQPQQPPAMEPARKVEIVETAPPPAPKPPQEPASISREELLDKWRDLSTMEVFNDVINNVRREENPENIALMLEVLFEILESRLKTFGGRLRYEINREIKAWKTGRGNVDELVEKLANWMDRVRGIVKF